MRYDLSFPQPLYFCIQSFNLSLDPRSLPTMENFPVARLPDELVEKIIKNAIHRATGAWRPGDSQAYRRRCAVIAELSLTCKRFHRIAEPFLCHTIDLSWPQKVVPPSERTVLFHRTMRSNPKLRTFCRHLDITIDEDYHRAAEDDFNLCNDLVRWLTNVTSFHVHGGFSHPSTYTLMKQAVSSMPQCQDLFLSQCYGDPLLVHLFKDIVTMQLRSLHLCSASQSDEGGNGILVLEVSCLHLLRLL